MKICFLALMLFGVICLNAKEKKEIHYYEAGSPQTGNLEYLNSRCVLDLKTPNDVKGFPTLVWFHGGGIYSGKKYYPPNLSYNKIACATVNYRLSGKGAECPDYIYDAAAAVAWVLKNIEKFGGDPKKVYVAGHSAGGYLSAMVALDPKYLKTFGASPTQLAAVFPISGQMTTHFTILNERRKKNPSTPQIVLDEYAPIALASKNIPPLFLIVGDADIEWPARVEENMLLGARLKRVFRDKNARVYALPAFNHGQVVTPGMSIVNNYILKKEKNNNK